MLGNSVKPNVIFIFISFLLKSCSPIISTSILLICTNGNHVESVFKISSLILSSKPGVMGSNNKLFKFKPRVGWKILSPRSVFNKFIKLFLTDCKVVLDDAKYPSVPFDL